jgi:hypothetical protein
VITDSEIRLNGIKALIESLGLVEAERFIALIRREPFDYTTWRKRLFRGSTIRDISRDAMRLREQDK